MLKNLKNCILFSLSNIFFFSATSAQSYWQQNVDCEITVSLDDVNHSITGTISMQYTNNAPQELSSLFFHVWPNAYRDNNSAFAKQELENKSVDFQFASSDERGYMNALAFTINGKAVTYLEDKEYQDIIEIKLIEPLKSGETIKIETPFFVKMPSSDFSRLGHSDQSYQLTQWFPKPAVYDKNGWNQFPYLNQGEFYSEFGNFHVFITVPSNYIVAASGDLQTQSEIVWLDSIAEATAKMEIPSNDQLDFPLSSSSTKTLEYKLENAHDFAWFADKRFHVLKGEVTLPYSQRKVKTYAYFTNLEASLWMKSIEYLNRSVLNYSEWVGEYQWNVCQALEGALSAGSGMEYPTITIIGESGNGQTLDNVITHEVGHNWFYGMLGSNERVHPWMDEGINSYYESRYMEKYYPGRTLETVLGGIPLPDEILNEVSLLEASQMLNGAFEKTNLSQSVSKHSMEYTSFNYGASVYQKTATQFMYLAEYMGQANFDRTMGIYFDQWKMKHPQPEDIQKVFETETAENMNWFFQQLLSSDRSIDYAIEGIEVGVNTIIVRVKNNSNIVAPFSISMMKEDKVFRTDWQHGFIGEQNVYLNKTKNDVITSVKINESGLMPEYDRENNTIKTNGLLKRLEPFELKLLTTVFDNPEKTSISYTPIFGANANDGFMLGLGIYNSTFAMPKIEYVLAPMYAFGSQKLRGQGSFGFNFYPENGFASRWRIATSAMQYAYYEKSVTDSALVTSSEFFDFTKVENKIQIDIRKKSLRNSPQQTITIRNIFIREADAGLPTENAIFGDSSFAMFNELNYLVNKKSILFPFSIQGNILIGEDFAKASLEGKIRVHYPKTKTGIDVRLFAGKYFGDPLLSQRTGFTTGGPNGYQDFLYDEIFFGRNKYESIYDHQIMMRDAFLKVPAAINTDLSLAVNFEFGIPKIPFALFLDVAYYPETKLIGESKIYDAGIMFRPVNDIFEIYYTVIKSDFLKPEIAETFSDNLSFMFDLNKLNVFDVLRKL